MSKKQTLNTIYTYRTKVKNNNFKNTLILIKESKITNLLVQIIYPIIYSDLDVIC